MGTDKHGLSQPEKSEEKIRAHPVPSVVEKCLLSGSEFLTTNQAKHAKMPFQQNFSRESPYDLPKKSTSGSLRD